MSQPFEIIAAPFEVYLAPVGTAFPAIDATPTTPWEILGTSGSKNITEDGITVTSEQTVERVYTLGTTGPVKAFRTQENLMIEFTLMDVSLEHYAKVLNNATVTDVAAGPGTAGYREIPLMQGATVATYALLMRGGVSPYGDGFAMQYQVPIAYQDQNPAPVYVKGSPAGLQCRFVALVDETQGFGKLVAQDAAPA